VALVVVVQAIGAAIAFTQWSGVTGHSDSAIAETGV
jgi:hypothetical protein